MRLEYGDCSPSTTNLSFGQMVGWNMKLTLCDNTEHEVCLVEAGCTEEGRHGFMFRWFVGDEHEAAGETKFVAIDNIDEMYVY